MILKKGEQMNEEQYEQFKIYYIKLGFKNMGEVEQFAKKHNCFNKNPQLLLDAMKKECEK